ncbi:MAG: radical SAM protein [Planctomycetes bacterium]|nr:radical SAM protein [Planctomycetota bacterium]MBL7037357.1 radical SAM protein [Pirellulaceae bacterium]
MLKLRSLALELTPRCNQQCLYCYNPWRSEPARATEEFSTDEICGLVDRVLEQAELEHLTLTGGEPLMRRDLFEIVDYVNGRGLSVVLISNGGLIDEKAAQMLADRDVRYVQVTFAGPEAHIHDALCGMGSFRGASSGLTNLVAAGVPVGGSFLCTRKNSLVAQTTLEWMYRNGVRSHFAFNRFNPSGYGAGHLRQLMPTRSNVLSALEQAERFAAAHEVRIHCTMPIPQCMINEQDYPQVRFGQCSAGTDRAEYAIDPRGRLKLCTLQRHTIGSVLENRLADLIADESIARFRVSIPVFCEPCPHRAGCLGGCGAAAEWTFGDPAQLDPFLAQHVMPDFAERLVDRHNVSPPLDVSPNLGGGISRPALRVRISLWYDLVYHVLSYLPLPRLDASTLFDEAYVRWCDRWFDEHAAEDQSTPRTVAEDAVILARLYTDSERGSLLHAWPLLHDGVDDFRRYIQDDFATLAWSSSQRMVLADEIGRGTEPALPDLFRTALWSELVNGYDAFHKERIAPVAEAYRERFTRQLTELAVDLPALSQPVWALSHPLRRHGRLLWPSPATPVIAVGVADDELFVSESAPVMQGCHEYFVLKAQAALPAIESGSPAAGQSGHEAFQILENAALTLGARFFANSPWEEAHQEWLRCIFPAQSPSETAARLASGEAVPKAVAAAIADVMNQP